MHEELPFNFVPVSLIFWYKTCRSRHCGPARIPAPLPAGYAPPHELPVAPLHTVPLCTCLRCPTEIHFPQRRRTLFVTPSKASHVRGTRMWRWSTFTPPRHAAYAAQCGLFLLRRSYPEAVQIDLRIERCSFFPRFEGSGDVQHQRTSTIGICCFAAS